MTNRFIGASCIAFLLTSGTVSAGSPMDALQLLKDANIAHGNADGSISGNITRQQLAIILAKAMNIDVGSGALHQSTFSDVPASAYSSSYIDAAIKSGQIVSSSDVFQAPLSHEQLKTVMVQALGEKTANVPDNHGNQSEWATGYIKTAVQTISSQAEFNPRPESVGALGAQAYAKNNQSNENATENSVQKLANAASGSETNGWANEPHPGWDDFSYFGAGALSPSAPPVQSGAYTYSGRMAGAFADGGAFNGATMILNFNLSSASIDGSMEFGNGIAPVTGSWAGNNINATFNGSDVQLGALNGNLKGGFYGPHQEQIGGTWSMTAGSRAASGQFAGSR